MYRVIIEKEVSKFLQKHIWEKIVVSFREKTTILSKNPYSKELNIKSLSWEKNKYRLRIWKYRFLYEVKKDILIISFFKADSRWWVYK